MFRFTVALIISVEALSLFVLPLVAPYAVVLVLAPLILLTVVLAFVLYPRFGRISYSTWRLTPESIAEQSTPETVDGVDPIFLARSIVERAKEIRRAMLKSPTEIEVEICALGYRACVNDMITLSHIANEELAGDGLLRRLRLKRARRRATEALSGARSALPSGALRATHQEKQ
jgi:hypothetical protein